MNFSGFFIPPTKNQNLKKSKRRLQFWATGMIEAQSFIAFKSKGCYIVKTYNLTSYKAITESKLSFENWDLAAEEYNGDITIKASLKIPAKQESLNQVWQVGSAVTNGMPEKHEFAAANIAAKNTLAVSGGNSSGCGNFLWLCLFCYSLVFIISDWKFGIRRSTYPLI